MLRRAQLRRAGERIEVLTLECAALAAPAGTGTANPVSPGARLSGDAAANSTTYVASMPAPDVMSRCWSFPPADDARSRQMVANRLDADLPTPMGELVWDYRRGDQVSPREPTTYVLAQASRQERVNRQLEALSARGVQVDALTTEAEALAALYRHGIEADRTEGADVLVLAGDDEWLIVMLAGGLVRLVRRIAVTPSAWDAACRECRQWIEADGSIPRCHRVLWCATPDVSDARHALAETIGMDVVPVQPSRCLVAADGGAITADRLVPFGAAIGLALAGLLERDALIRFAGREEEAAAPRHARLERLLSHPWRLTAAAVSLLVVAFAIHAGALAWESGKLGALLEDRDETSSRMTALEPKIRAMHRLDRWRIDVEGITAAICPHVPDDMIISSIQLSRERGLTIQGTVGDLEKAFALAEELRKNDQRFADVQIGRTEPAKGGGFTITADLVGVESLTSTGAKGGVWH